MTDTTARLKCWKMTELNDQSKLLLMEISPNSSQLTMNFDCYWWLSNLDRLNDWFENTDCNGYLIGKEIAWTVLYSMLSSSVNIGGPTGEGDQDTVESKWIDFSTFDRHHITLPQSGSTCTQSCMRNPLDSLTPCVFERIIIGMWQSVCVHFRIGVGVRIRYSAELYSTK